MTFTLFGQGGGPYPTVNHTYHPNTKTMSYSLNNSHPSWAAFYFFGDGYYTLQHAPTHEYDQADIYDTEVYVARGKKPTLPGKMHTIQTTNLAASINTPGTTRAYRFPQSNTNPTALSTVKVGTSWGALSDTNMILIVSFKHPGNHTDPIDGSIELLLDSRIMFHKQHTPHVNSNAFNWVSNFNISTIGGINRYKWNFNSLENNEIRHIYIEVEFPGSMASLRTSPSATMKWEDILGFHTENHGLPIHIARHPRDPNFIEVNEEKITPYHPTPQKLEYEVGFYNDGTWYAKDVIVDVTIDVEESIGAVTAKFLESSDPCTMSIVADDKIRFTFNDIYLPGINQDTSFTMDQCSGSLKFSVCVYENLDPNELILASALIYFDTLAPIPTGQDTTIVSYEAPAVSGCDDDQVGFWSNDDPEETLEEAPENKIYSAYPNPFSNQLNVSYEVTEDNGSNVSLKLYNMTRQKSYHLLNAYHKKGIHNFSYDSSSLPAGIYLLEILDGTQRTTQRLIKMN